MTPQGPPDQEWLLWSTKFKIDLAKQAKVTTELSTKLTKCNEELAKCMSELAGCKAELADRQAELVDWKNKQAASTTDSSLQNQTLNAELGSRISSVECKLGDTIELHNTRHIRASDLTTAHLKHLEHLAKGHEDLQQANKGLSHTLDGRSSKFQGALSDHKYKIADNEQRLLEIDQYSRKESEKVSKRLDKVEAKISELHKGVPVVEGLISSQSQDIRALKIKLGRTKASGSGEPQTPVHGLRPDQTELRRETEPEKPKITMSLNIAPQGRTSLEAFHQHARQAVHEFVHGAASYPDVARAVVDSLREDHERNRFREELEVTGWNWGNVSELLKARTCEISAKHPRKKRKYVGWN